MTHKKPLIVLIVVAFIMLLLLATPFFVAWNLLDGKWPAVPVSFSDDLYYYARIREVIDGKFFLGNPYFLEHSHEIPPAFFVADWLAAIPLMIGIPLLPAAAGNFVLWSMIFFLISYLLCRQVSATPRSALAGSIMAYALSYTLILRPVSMQIIFPFFLLFLFSYARWLEKPFQKNRIILLTSSFAFSFYLYTYFWQITTGIMALSLLYFLMTKRISEACRLLLVLVGGVFLAIPMIIFIVGAWAHPFFWESMVRIGLVYTHVPTAETFYSGQWIVAVLMLWWASLRWIPSLRADVMYRQSFLFFSLSGLAMIGVSASNLITGKELETAQHVARFIGIWLGIAYIRWCSIFFSQGYSGVRFVPMKKLFLLACLLAWSTVGIGTYLENVSVLFPSLDHRRTAQENQTFFPPLHWLEQQESVPHVVWTHPGSRIDTFVPILTKHYVLFSNPGILHLLSSDEAEERYLISRYFSSLSVADIERDTREYAGVGFSHHQYKTHNRKVRLCRLLRLSLVGVACGEYHDAVTHAGKFYFEQLSERYRNDIIPQIEKKLTQYHVTYIIFDASSTIPFAPEALSNTRLEYDDGRFRIYRR
ncbi:MAG: hypothetical protein AAB932_03110 [Patescibacteria group bacterium]